MNKNIIPRNISGWLVPIVLGIIAFCAVVGPNILYPGNIRWLQHGDPATHYLGWLFFRQSGWTFPIGLNPAYGLEVGNAIIYSDSIPLLAIVFKTISGLLPDAFQYFGLWLLACFILQGMFGWKLSRTIQDSFFFNVICTSFFILSPPMMWRLNARIGHLSLAGHFLILAALALALQKHRRAVTAKWAVLLGATAAIHIYFLSMVAAIWLGDLADRLLNRRADARMAGREVLFIGAIVGLVLWQIGMFSVLGGSAGEGYGSYRFNLTSLFDPGKLTYEFWSYILPDMSGDEGQHESFNFLGLGILLLVPAALFALPRNRRLLLAHCGERAGLATAILMLAALAFTPRIGIASHDIGYVVTNIPALKILSIFRSSARMFWPAYYMIYAILFWMIIRGYPRRVAIAILSVALLIQVVDESAGWRRVGAYLKTDRSAQWNTPLKSPFWSCAAATYRNVRTIRQRPDPRNWATFAYYAGTHHMGTDIVYLARTSRDALAIAAHKADLAVRTGAFDRDSLYILDGDSLRMAQAHIDRRQYGLARIDGFIVLAPVPAGRAACLD